MTGGPPRTLRAKPAVADGFETEDAVAKEDEQRAQALCNFPGRSPADQTACNRLARRIRKAALGEDVTPASATSMRVHRINLIEDLSALCQGRPTFHVVLMPRGMSVSPDGLAGVDPGVACQWLKMTLRRKGATNAARGWIYAYLEGEYNPETGMIQLHWHLIVRGRDMVAAVKGLRQHSRFRRVVGAANNPDGIDVRVHGKRVAQSDLAKVIGYTTKGAWYAKWRCIDADGNRRSQARRFRIPEPANTKVLLWLDRWRVGDMTMLINLRAGRKGLAPYRR